MGNILLSLDYGRRAEYIFCSVMSPYALTIPIKGLDDKIESDFLCVALKNTKKDILTPDLRQIFFVQCKSRKKSSREKFSFGSSEQLKSILSNKLPYLIALVFLEPEQKVEIYNTSERIALCHQYPGIENILAKLDIHFGWPKGKINQSYSYREKDKTAKIFTGDPVLEFSTQDLKRNENTYEELSSVLLREMENYHYTSVGLSSFKRTRLPWGDGSETDRLFYPLKGEIPGNTISTINLTQRLIALLNKNRSNLPNFKNIENTDFIKNDPNNLQRIQS